MTEAQRKELNPPPCSAVLDACCGSRMMWVDKRDERVTFVDRRNEYYEIKPDRAYPNGTVIRVRPDVVADFTALPFPDAIKPNY